MKNKSIIALLCIILIFSLFPITASADMGPKASVIINFENMGDELCYGTLLSEKKSTGPHMAWNGNEAEARHNENPNYSYQTFDYEIWKVFTEYKDKDGYYFLQIGWNVSENKKIDWTYCPPDAFKILLYYPETQTFVVSGIYKKYAFDSYYTVDMEGINIGSVEYNEKLSSDKRYEEYLAVLKAERSYEYKREIISLILRIVITILIETVIAMFFGFRNKKQILLIIGVNILTQIFLNFALNITAYDLANCSLLYMLSEIIIFALESAIYCKWMKKISNKPKKNRYCILYALIANAASFGAGILISQSSLMFDIL